MSYGHRSTSESILHTKRLSLVENRPRCVLRLTCFSYVVFLLLDNISYRVKLTTLAEETSNYFEEHGLHGLEFDLIVTLAGKGTESERFRALLLEHVSGA